MAKDILVQSTSLTTELAYSLSVLISAMLLTDCCPILLRRQVFDLHNSQNDRSTEDGMILDSYAKIQAWKHATHSVLLIRQ